MIHTPISATMTQNGEDVEDPVLSLLQDTVVTYELDADGYLLAVRGYDSLSKKLNETLPPLAVKSLSAFLSEEALAKNDATAWNRRIGRFLGQSAKLGDVWTATDQTSLPTGGAVFYYSAAKLAEQVKYEGVNCVRILYS